MSKENSNENINTDLNEDGTPKAKIAATPKKFTFGKVIKYTAIGLAAVAVVTGVVLYVKRGGKCPDTLPVVPSV